MAHLEDERSAWGRIVETSPTDAALLEVSSGRLCAVSQSAAEALGATADELVGTDLHDYVEEDDAANRSLALLRRGAIDGYEASRTIVRMDGTTLPAHLWVRAIDTDGDREYAYVLGTRLVLNSSATQVPDLVAPHLAHTRASPPIVLGTVDRTWRVERMAGSVHRLIGWSAEECRGASVLSVVDPADVVRILQGVIHALDEKQGVSLTLRLLTKDGQLEPVHVMVMPFGDDEPRFGFVLSQPSVRAELAMLPDREAVLQHHLWRIAREVEAAGIARGLESLPSDRQGLDLESLSARQWEILTRLLKGERAPAIARSLYVSPSTVRNHLSVMFRKFGVSSQAELIDIMRGASERPPASD